MVFTESSCSVKHERVGVEWDIYILDIPNLPCKKLRFHFILAVLLKFRSHISKDDLGKVCVRCTTSYSLSEARASSDSESHQVYGTGRYHCGGAIVLGIQCATRKNTWAREMILAIERLTMHHSSSQSAIAS